MSGTGKKVVDVAWKASRNIDRDSMAKMLVSDEARQGVLFTPPCLRRKLCRNLNRQIGNITERESASCLVDMYKEAYDSIAVVFLLACANWINCSNGTIGPVFGNLRFFKIFYGGSHSLRSPIKNLSWFSIISLIELKEAEEKSLKESERFEKEKKISTVTADEYFEKHPELKKKFDDEIRDDYWGY
ncbi:hypothetical protein Pint_32228 [Pistacia integerrima]|uniref:Uncharacterized protein n=1 Tax=Pistacia integerrima TaxID=434235 RepID=A0ACC0XNK5_9ROSI|nr:hypothetical protein Pint_32228 [Pistacia integerrima]